MTTEAFTGITPHARSALRRLRLQLDRLAIAPLSGMHRSQHGGRGLEFDQVVKYAYGDDIREIDWNVTARRGEMHRKTYIEDREINLVCVFADHPALQFGSQATAKRERLLEALSLLMMFAAEQQQKISLLHMHGSNLDVLPFTRDRHRILRIITSLYSAAAPAVTHPGPETPPLEQLRRIGRGHIIIWLGEIPERLPDADWLALTRRHSSMAIRVEDPWERLGPGKAMTVFDPISQRLVDLPATTNGTKQYREWREHRERVWAAWWPRQDHRLVIDNDDGNDTFTAVSEFLGRRRNIIRTPAG